MAGIAVLVVAAVAAGVWAVVSNDGQPAAAPQQGIPSPVHVATTTTTIAPHRDGRVTTWRVPEALVGLRSVAIGPDGRVWLTEQNRGQVEALAGNELTRYEVSKLFPDAGAFAFSWGPQGALWFTGYPGGTLGRVLPDGSVNLFESRGTGATTLGITQAADGSMWTTDPNLGALIRVGTDGTVTPVPVSSDGGQTQRPGFIVPGADGLLWFTIPDTSQVASVTTTGTPTITRYDVPGHVVPRNIVADGAGTLWVTLEDSPALARVDEATGKATIVPLAGSVPTDGLNDLALAADGTLWVTTPSSAVLHVDPDGRILDRVAVPGTLYTDGIAIAPDGSVWVAARDDVIARIAG